MKKKDDMIWSAKVTLSPGRYEYKFLVDGMWAEEVPCVERAKNSFGTDNYVITIR